MAAMNAQASTSDWKGFTPAQVATRLRHLPGFVWFDTAGNLPTLYGKPTSILAARPVVVIKGTLTEAADRQALRLLLQKHGSNMTPDQGHLNGGLCGWVEYDGRFVFGVYPEMLVFTHQDQVWNESGHLSRELAEPIEEEPFRIGPFQPETTREEFLAAVRRSKEYIAAGDIYQVNLSQQFSAEVSGGSLFSLYETLRTCSPAPMASWLSLAGREVLSSSPETFLRMTGNVIETRPIKGTRPRHADPDADEQSAKELQTSEKETAELVMITDLLRNDLGQVCEFGSVHVEEMLQLEKLEQVHHLVSTVKGTLRADTDHIDALAACFPGGSITGAPKKRAREIIAELETVPRGLYCGAIGYFGFNGESQFNIAIRTLIRECGRLHYHVGAGIVADSSPELEFEETLHKAAGIRKAVETATYAD